LIHRDVKPDNFLFGLSQEEEKEEELYIIDFGLCKKYTTDAGRHMPFRTGRPLVGTPNFVSLNVHDGVEASRRDDLESLCYIWMFLVKGGLPWASETDLAAVRRRKADIVGGNGVPQNLQDCLLLCRSLQFDEEPNYRKFYEIIG